MNQQIINLRAFAITLIVLGHSIIIYDKTFNLFSTDIEMPLFEIIKHVISFIQLKLFFAISGFLLYYKTKQWSQKKYSEILRGFRTFVKNKFFRLIIPFICVCFFYMDPIKLYIGVSGYDWKCSLLLQQLYCVNIGHLWFLPCLFLIFIIIYFCMALIRNNRNGLLVLFLLFALLNYKSNIFPDIFQLKEVAYYLVYFYLGYLINYINSVYSRKIVINKSILIGVLFVLIIVGYFIRQVTSIGFEFYSSIFCVLCCFYIMPNNKCDIVNKVSRYAYGIYLFHSPLIYITAIYFPNINPWLMLGINFILFGGIAYCLAIMLSKSYFKFIVGE